nr:zinc finger, CCHC-type, retrotransposon Gag domain protein [Tanacetum cinerariifolium]
QTLLPQIREEIREEFRTGSGSSNAGRNPSPVTIHTWLERFNKQKPHSFEKAIAPVGHGDMGRLQEVVLSLVFPSNEAGALEEGVSFHSSDKY